jgi:general stress protein YciG
MHGGSHAETRKKKARKERRNTMARGFAAMIPEKQREIARKGGVQAHKISKAHTFTSEEARAAGAKGGRKLATDRQHMSDIGRKGGVSSTLKRRAAATAVIMSESLAASSEVSR